MKIFPKIDLKIGFCSTSFCTLNYRDIPAEFREFLVIRQAIKFNFVTKLNILFIIHFLSEFSFDFIKSKMFHKSLENLVILTKKKQNWKIPNNFYYWFKNS